MNASELSFRPAGFAKRLLAFAIDFLLIAAYILVLIGIGTGTLRITGELVVLNSPWTMDLFAFLVLIVPVILYFALQDLQFSRERCFALTGVERQTLFRLIKSHVEWRKRWRKRGALWTGSRS